MALHLPIRPLKTRSGLEPVPRCEPSTTAPSGPVSYTYSLIHLNSALYRSRYRDSNAVLIPIAQPPIAGASNLAIAPPRDVIATESNYYPWTTNLANNTHGGPRLASAFREDSSAFSIIVFHSVMKSASSWTLSP